MGTRDMGSKWCNRLPPKQAVFACFKVFCKMSVKNHAPIVVLRRHALWLKHVIQLPKKPEVLPSLRLKIEHASPVMNRGMEPVATTHCVECIK